MRNCDIEKSFTAKGLHTAHSVFRDLLSGCDVCSAYRRTHTLTSAHTSCSDMFRLFVLLLFVPPTAREPNSTERKEVKKQNKRHRGIVKTHTHTHTHMYTKTSAVNFSFHGDKFSHVDLFVLLETKQALNKKKNKVKRITNLFSSLSPDMNCSPKPCECFRRKYFLWMCLRGSAHCRKKTKVGAVYFLHSSVV